MSSKTSRTAISAAIGTAVTLAMSTMAFAPAFAAPVDPATVTITWTTGITDGATYQWGHVPDAGSCTATSSDETVLLDCAVTGSDATLTAVGQHSVTATATVQGTTEVASFETRGYTVAGYAAKFYAPLNKDVTMVKAGRTVPVKFKVWYDQAMSQKAKSKSVVTSLVATEFLCTDPTTVLSQKDLLSSTAKGFTLKYRDGAFHLNWKVAKPAKAKGKKVPGPQVCGLITLTAEDSSAISAKFQLK